MGRRAGLGKFARVGAVVAIAVATLVGISGAPAGAVSVGTLVLVAPAAPSTGYGVGVCPDGQNFQGWATFTCSGGAPNYAALLPPGGSQTITLEEGLYKGVVGTGPGLFGPEGPITVVAGRVTTCTLSMTDPPDCVVGPATGTLVVNVAGVGGSYAVGACLAPGLPVVGSTTCTDGSSANVRFGLTGGSTVSYSLVPGTYTGGIASLTPTLTGGPSGPIQINEGSTATCTFSMVAPPACVYTGTVTVPSATGSGTVALAGSGGAALSDLSSSVVPASPAPPPGLTFPVGLVGFTVTGIAAGGSADVVLTLPAGSNPSGYAKLHDGVWEDFSTNATIVGDTVTLHLVDGGAGDDDGLANGTIVDPGAPFVGYSFTGFRAPVDNLVVNSAKAGQAIPVKWTILSASGAPVADAASFVSLRSSEAPCGASAPDGIEAYTSESSGLQYLGDGNWQFNWKTEKTWAGQCRILTLKLADGTSHTAQFTFK